MAKTTPIQTFVGELITAAESLKSAVVATQATAKTNNLTLGRLFFSPQGVELADLALPDMSAHQTLQWRSSVAAITSALEDAIRASGLLDVGLRHMNVEVCTDKFSAITLSIYHSHQIVRPTAFLAKNAKQIATFLKETAHLLGQHTFPREPLQSFMVERDRVNAPNAQTAIVLWLYGHNRDRLYRLINQGPKPGTRLRVAQVVTEDGESLFSTPA